jgi:hypothetical protein
MTKAIINPGKAVSQQFELKAFTRRDTEEMLNQGKSE